jgi:phasin
VLISLNFLLDDLTREEDPMVDNHPFEIPQQFRDLAEKNVEQASAAYEQFMDAMAQAIGMWWGALPPNEMTAGFKAVQDRAVRFAKQNADAGFALASSLANAKDLQEVLQLQSQYAQSQMQTYAAQAQELGRLMSAAAKSKL